MALFRHMRANNDPMAIPVLYFTRFYGWTFFNYHHGLLWQGQLIRKLWPGYNRRHS